MNIDILNHYINRKYIALLLLPQTKMNNFLNTNICNVFHRESLNSCFAKSFEDI